MNSSSNHSKEIITNKMLQVVYFVYFQINNYHFCTQGKSDQIIYASHPFHFISSGFKECQTCSSLLLISKSWQERLSFI
jgi:hypothetical protein